MQCVGCCAQLRHTRARAHTHAPHTGGTSIHNAMPTVCKSFKTIMIRSRFYSFVVCFILPTQVHKTSLIPPDQPESDVQPVLSGIIAPLLEACRLSSDGLDPSDGAVFMLNNVDVVREALVAHQVSEQAKRYCSGSKPLLIITRNQRD